MAESRMSSQSSTNTQLTTALKRVFGQSASPIYESLIAFEAELKRQSLESATWGLNEFKRLVLADEWGKREPVVVEGAGGKTHVLEETGAPQLNNLAYWRSIDVWLSHISFALQDAPPSLHSQPSWRKLKTLFAAFLMAIAGALVAVQLGAVGGLTIAGYAAGSAAAGAFSYLSCNWYEARAKQSERHRLFRPLQKAGHTFVKVVDEQLIRQAPDGAKRGERYTSHT